MRDPSIRDLLNPSELIQERLIRQVRAQRAISRIRRRAEEMGLDRWSADDIDEEIRLAREERIP